MLCPAHKQYRWQLLCTYDATIKVLYWYHIRYCKPFYVIVMRINNFLSIIQYLTIPLCRNHNRSVPNNGDAFTQS